MKARRDYESICETLFRRFKPAFFKALCDPNRLAIVARLACASGPMTVSEVGGCCGVHISGVSRHLAMLRDAGIVSAEKNGREVSYRLNPGLLAGALRAAADAIENSVEPAKPQPPKMEKKR
ncbi:metalloregulator ArsR/SmtB family transcription factor [bacterium]|nr:metalloregulator ArsR/SmtB family transcription factor [bacterium]